MVGSIYNSFFVGGNSDIMEEIFLTLKDYGALGLFVLYLIYDRQVIIKSLKKSIDELKQAINQKRI